MKNKKAFTLIELLVVIAIIGILATLAIVALQQARQNARDAKRVADVKQMSTALEMYFNEHQAYPDSLDDLEEAGYMQIIPKAPTPADKGCEDSNDYEYSVSDNKDHYQLRFCTGKQVADLSPGSLCMTPGGLSVNCEGSMSGVSCLTNLEGCEWVEVGVTGFATSPPLGERTIYAHNGNVYVFFKDSSFSGAGTVKKFNGTSWENLGEPGFTDGGVGYLSIAGSGNKIYVSFQEQNSSVAAGKVSVMKYENGAWSYVGQRGMSSGSGNETSLQVHKGIPYVTFTENYNQDSWNYKIYAMKFNGSDWENVGEINHPANSAIVSMIVDNNGVLYVAYKDQIDYPEGRQNRVSVIKYNGSGWEYVGSPNFTATSPREISLAVSNDGTPYVAYYTADSYNVAVYKFDGSDWVYTNYKTYPYTKQFSLRIFTQNNIPYITFLDVSNHLDGDSDKRLSAMRLDGDTWKYVGNAGFSDNMTSAWSSMYIDNDTIYVGFMQNMSTYRVMKYSRVRPAPSVISCSNYTNQDSCSYNGDVYRVVKIGDQTWFADNLNTSLYNDGVTEIELNHDTWTEGVNGIPAWTWPGNKISDIYKNYGKLYNAYAFEDGNLCPLGWRVPGIDDFTDLERGVCDLMGNSNCETTFPYGEFYGWRGNEEGSALAGGLSLWESGGYTRIFNTLNFGISGFNALPIDMRGGHGQYFDRFGQYSYFWTTDIRNPVSDYGWVRYLSGSLSEVASTGYPRHDGYAVRCLKD